MPQAGGASVPNGPPNSAPPAQLLASARGAVVGEGGTDAGPEAHPPLGRVPWTLWATSPRAQALHMDAMSGLRASVEPAPDRALVARWSDAAGAWVPWLEMQRPPVALFAAQLDAVDAMVPLRESRGDEIVAQANAAMGFLLAVAGVPWERRGRSLEFLAAALAVQQAVQQRLKQQLGCARPHQYRASLLPYVEVPGHATLPSGHAGESHLVAAIVGHWIRSRYPRDERPAMLDRMALRIAENRVVAGVHFPLDSLAGRWLGQAVFQHLRCLAGDEGAAPLVARFAPADAKGDWMDHAADRPLPIEQREDWPLSHFGPSTHAIDASSDWQQLWLRACEEW